MDYRIIQGLGEFCVTRGNEVLVDWDRYQTIVDALGREGYTMGLIDKAIEYIIEKSCSTEVVALWR